MKTVTGILLAAVILLLAIGIVQASTNQIQFGTLQYNSQHEFWINSYPVQNRILYIHSPSGNPSRMSIDNCVLLLGFIPMSCSNFTGIIPALQYGETYEWPGVYWGGNTITIQTNTPYEKQLMPHNQFIGPMVAPFNGGEYIYPAQGQSPQWSTGIEKLTKDKKAYP